MKKCIYIIFLATINSIAFAMDFVMDVEPQSLSQFFGIDKKYVNTMALDVHQVMSKQCLSDSDVWVVDLAIKQEDTHDHSSDQYSYPLKSAYFNKQGTEIMFQSCKLMKVIKRENGVQKFIYNTPHQVYSAQFDSTGNAIVVVEGDFKVYILDAGGNKKNDFGFCGGMKAQFNQIGTEIIMARNDGTVGVIDSNNGKSLLKLPSHNGGITHVCFNYLGTQLATASYDNDKAHIWNRENGKKMLQLSHEKVVYSVYFNRKGTKILTASCDGTIRLWNNNKASELYGKELWRVKHVVPVDSAVFHPAEKTIMAVIRDCTVRIYDKKTRTELIKLVYDAGVSSAGFNHQGTEIVTTSNDHMIRVWAQYKDYTLPQIMLRKIIHVWLCLKKPDKAINGVEKLLCTIGSLLNCDQTEIMQVWRSFPVKIQSFLWSFVEKQIQRDKIV